MALAGISTLGITFGYGVEATAGTKPASFTKLTRINSIGGITVENEQIDASAIEDAVSRYVQGRGDTGGTFSVGVNFTPETKAEKIEKTRLMVFDSLEDAQKEISDLSKAYRRDDVAFTPQIKSKFIRHFYLIKLDSPKCPVIIDETSKEKPRKGNFYWYKIKQIRN